jgi:hypothetical protein
MSSLDIIEICESTFPHFWDDCAGFVRTVAQKCGVFISGNANGIVDNQLSGNANFTSCSEREALIQAQAGNLVIGGLSAPGHGHVVVVVDVPLDHGHVVAYWGRYHALTLGKGKHEMTINVGSISLGKGGISKAWKLTELAKVKFGWTRPSEFFVRKNTPTQRSYHL